MTYEDDDEVENPDQEIEKVTSEEVQKYLNEKYGGKGPDSEIEDWLSDRFDSHDLPNGQKIKLSVKEMLEMAEKRSRGL